MANGKQFVEELIEVFKSQPSLWQSKSDIYKNRVEKLKSWNILLEKYKEVEREATIDCVKKKINCLRITYRRELLKIVKSERSGAGADDIYTPSLWYFNQLDFLRDQEIQDESLSTLNCLEGSKMEKPTKRKRGNELEEDFLNKAAEYLDQGNSSTQKDDAQLFADGWAAMYRKIDQNQQMFAKRIIDEALMQGKMGLLTFSSFISSGEQRGQQYVPFRPTYFQTPSPNDIQNSSSTGSSYSTTTIPQLSPYATFTPSPVAIDPTTTQNIQILSHEVLSEATSIQQLFNDPNYK